MGRSIGVLALAFAAACAAADEGDEDEYGEPPDDFELDGELPVVVCEGDSEAHANLNAFWFAFESEYGLFDSRLPNGDWQALGLDACAQIGDGQGVDDNALFDVLIGLARNLDDGHVVLTAPISVVTKTRGSTRIPITSSCTSSSMRPRSGSSTAI